MEEMMCCSCKNSREGINPKNIEDIDNGCKLPSILRALKLDENRLYCPHFLTNEKVCNVGYEPTLSEELVKMKDEYPDGKCPDCFETINDDVVDGDKCQNCGHVFRHLENENENEKRKEKKRDMKDICRENKAGRRTVS